MAISSTDFTQTMSDKSPRQVIVRFYVVVVVEMQRRLARWSGPIDWIFPRRGHHQTGGCFEVSLTSARTSFTLCQSAAACLVSLRCIATLAVGTRTGRSIVYSLYDGHVAQLLDEAVYHSEHLRLDCPINPKPPAEPSPGDEVPDRCGLACAPLPPGSPIPSQNPLPLCRVASDSTESGVVGCPVRIQLLAAD